MYVFNSNIRESGPFDWLNKKTSDDVGFFGLEIELWQIGDSVPAPKFNLVPQPNEWGRTVRPSASGGEEPTDTKLLQNEFWESMIEHFQANGTHLSLRKARPQHWYDIGIGKSNIHISLTVNSREKRLSCGLYISGERAKSAYAQLHDQKDAIESELMAELAWRELPNRQASRTLQLKEGDIENCAAWSEYFDWFKERSEAFHRVFGKRAAMLSLGD